MHGEEKSLIKKFDAISNIFDWEREDQNLCGSPSSVTQFIP
jgi:hypothetical protein